MHVRLSTSQLSIIFNWIASTDALSGIGSYNCRVETTSAGSDSIMLVEYSDISIGCAKILPGQSMVGLSAIKVDVGGTVMTNSAWRTVCCRQTCRFEVGSLKTNMLRFALCSVMLVSLMAQSSSASKTKVLLLSEDFPGTSKAFAQQLERGLSGDNFDVGTLDAATLASRLNSVIHGGSILVLPNARYFPTDAIASLDGFLKRGNHLFAISGPALAIPVVKKDGAWVNAGSDVKPLVLESICPQYKTYITTAAYIEVAGGNKRYAIKNSVCTSQSRSGGYLCDTLHKWRQMPFAYALDDSGKRKGIVGELFLNNSGEYSRSIWGYLGLEQSNIENDSDAYIPIIVSQLKRMGQGVFIANAGSDAFGYAVGEQARLGAYITNLSWKRADVRVDCKILSGKRVVLSCSTNAEVPSGSCDVATFVPSGSIKLPAGDYTAKTTLRIGGSVVDEVSHGFSVIDYNKLPDAEIVKVVGGDFYLNGKLWYPLGIAYWPLYISGLESGDYWEQTWSGSFYDPGMIERDFTLMGDLGINTISIQYNRLDQARGVMDLLARAQKHGLKVHLFLPGLSPIDQDFDLARSLIKAAHLSQSPALFAYDLGWEMHVGPYKDRQKYDGLWQKWVVGQYGSIDAAEQDWGYTPEKPNGVITGPSDDQLMQDGLWNVYVAAYRRFWDDEISKRYAKVRGFVKSLDSNHLMGARSGYGGTGAFWVAGVLPFDLASGAKHLDFISPEAYNVGGEWIDFLKAGMTDAYARFVSGGKPVFWAEFSIPLFSGANCAKYHSEMSMANWDRQRDYVHNMVSAAHVVGSNGVAAWWWPGGLRCDEKSDFGIVAPDGSPRPAAYEIAGAWNKSASIGDVSKPGVVFTIDRDLYASGYAGVYDAYSVKVADSLSKGAVAGLKTIGTATTSADVPLISVGNAPYKGHGPLKYLNSEFNSLKVNGKLVRDGDCVEIKPGETVVISASLGNTGEAAWLAKGIAQRGGVCLQVEAGDRKAVRAIKAEAGFLSDAVVPEFEVTQMTGSPVNLVARMIVTGRAEFGEKIKIKLLPAKR